VNQLTGLNVPSALYGIHTNDTKEFGIANAKRLQLSEGMNLIHQLVSLSTISTTSGVKATSSLMHSAFHPIPLL
jgi:hypothetical protein